MTASLRQTLNLILLAPLCVTQIVLAAENSTGQVDRIFIANAIGKTVPYTQIGNRAEVPNCVATVLRAGRILPAFALNDPIRFYEVDLPACFSRRRGPPRAGDMGVVFDRRTRMLWHAVLFVGENQVFEKASPDDADHFQLRRWDQIIRENRLEDSTRRFSVYRFSGGPKCALTEIQKKFDMQPADSLIKRATQEIEWRISKGDWNIPSSLKIEEVDTAWSEIQQSRQQDRWKDFEANVFGLLLRRQN